MAADTDNPQSGAVIREGLFALGTSHDSGDRVRTIVHIRDLTEDERIQTWVAEDILSRLTAESGFADVSKSHADLLASIEALNQAGKTQGALDESANVRRRFRHWLNDFRSFDDRTSAWISRVFGKDHEAYALFKRRLSAEYDSNFAYRLSSALRNVSMHEAEVINHAMWHVDTGDDGVIRTIPAMQFDGPALVRTFPDLKATVAKELAILRGRIDLAPVAHLAMLSCKHAYLALVDALWDEIAPERELCTGIHKEALDAGGECAIFVNLDTLNPHEGRMDHRYNAYHLVDLVEQHRQQALEWRDAAPVEAAAEALAEISVNI